MTKRNGLAVTSVVNEKLQIYGQKWLPQNPIN